MPLIHLLVAALLAVPAFAQSTTPHWRAIGPTGGEAPRALVAHPTTPGVVYAAAQFGVLKSLDGGSSWTYVAYGRALRLQHVAVNPLAPDVVLAGGMNGLIRSVDGGATWQTLSTEAIDAMAFDATGALFVAWSERGLMRSTNDGTTWSAAASGLSSQRIVTELVAAAGVLYATQGSSVMRWDGARWQLAGRPGSSDITAFAVDRNGTFYAADAEGIARSTNGGSSWTRINDGLPPSFVPQRTDFVTDLATDPNGTAVYAALFESGIYRAPDGAHWEQAGPRSANVNPAALLVAGSSLLATSSPFAITLSDDAGVTWRAASAGLSDHDIRDLTTVAGTLYATSFSGPALFATANGGASWTNFVGLPPSPIMSVAVAPSDPNRIYVGTGGHDVWVSSNRGQTWEHRPSGGGTIHRMSVDPTNPFVAYAVATGFAAYRTADGGVTWTEITKSFTFATTMVVRSVTVDPHQPSVLYLSAEKTYISRDAGVTWTALAGAGNFATATEEAAYAFFSRSVSRSTDAGVTWTAVTPPLPPEFPSRDPIVDMAIDESLDAIYIAVRDPVAVPTRVKIFRSVAGGGWEILPEASSPVLTLEARGGVLYAGTETQGVFAMSFVPQERGTKRRSVRS